MNIKMIKSIEIQATLTIQEVDYLQRFTQNYTGNIAQDESFDDKAIREELHDKFEEANQTWINEFE